MDVSPNAASGSFAGVGRLGPLAALYFEPTHSLSLRTVVGISREHTITRADLL